jgi:hypothetical protein
MERLHGHLTGYNTDASPKVQWPERLAKAKRQIREGAKNRGENRRQPYVH